MNGADGDPIEYASFDPKTGANGGDGADEWRSAATRAADAAAASTGDGWPLSLSGVTESLVTTRGPNGRWNLAPLGLFADSSDSGTSTETVDSVVTAKTWGRTRTRRNFEREGTGWVQFSTDPVAFVDAALSIVELDEPVLVDAAAWVRVDVERVESGDEDGTEWVRWRLRPTAGAVRRTRVPRFARAPIAVVEASVAASRLDAPGYDAARGRAVIARAGETVRRTGDERTVRAFDRLLEHAGLDDPSADGGDR
ncbi:DUF447 domain-containing protein [Halovivax limisalsi]|uniref:DUF447 domain-containing protein n=1 Tax=Halovivax limisalsi TaxID=1453760 RepID=UPI001FFC3973|nr:DUF447 domain-containing protein [Halovivax limisalsi]